MTMSDCAATAAPDLERLGAALGQRVRSVAAAVRRLDGLQARGLDASASTPDSEDVREFVLRALRTAASRDGDQLLRAVAQGISDPLVLAERTRRPRLALWEAVSDLVQVGLLERDPVLDRVHLTAAGDAVLGLVDLLVTAGESQ
jgi:DNA-binding IclR family transcriptional regulator